MAHVGGHVSTRPFIAYQLIGLERGGGGGQWWKCVVRVSDEHRYTHIAPVIARESGRSAARVGIDPKFGTIVIAFSLPIGLGLHPSPP